MSTTRALRIGRRRRGIVALLAMLYLVLIAALAIGFYEATTTSAEVSNNDAMIARSYTAAESGMNFMRSQLATLTIPDTVQATHLYDGLYTALGQQLNDTDNMPAAAKQISRSSDGTVIYVPAKDQYITLDGNGSAFRAEIIKELSGERIQVRVFGRYGPVTSNASRGIQLDYVNMPLPTRIFNYGVATRGTVSLGSNTSITSPTNAALGSVLSTSASGTPITLGSHSVISGDVSMTGSGTISYSGSPTVAGLAPSAWSSHVHQSTPSPTFPVADTSAFEDYLNNHSPTIISTPIPLGTSFTNIRIKAGANPVFAGGTTINGVVIVESPNIVTFAGNGTLNGVIAAASSVGSNTALNALNSLVFTGNFTANDPSKLPDSFGDLKKMSGSVILAPTFSVSFAGTANSIGGSVIGSKISMTGVAGGSIDGIVLNLDNQPLTLTGSSAITIVSPGTGGYPAGLRFGSHYDPLADTYKEISQ